MTTPQFISRNGALLTNNSLNLTAENDYKIDDVPVISAKALGVTVTTSNLKQLGTLNALSVSGDTVLGDFAFFNTTFNRLGLGTDEPSASISIIDNNVEIGLGSPDYDRAEFGTYSNHTLTIVTDGLPRIAIKGTGVVDFNSDVNIKGTLTVSNLVSDTRVTKTTSVDFLPDTESGIYGLGLTWSAVDYQKQFIMRSDPDRIWSTNSIDLEKGQAYYISGRAVLNETVLGSSVTQSNLVTVGALQELTVTGPAIFQNSITALNADLATKSLLVSSSQLGDLYIQPGSISSSGDLYIRRKQNDILGASDSGIQIGNHVERVPVKIINQLSINVNNPDPRFDLEVAGNVKFAGKKFIQGFDAPTQGDFIHGDICWNSNPRENSYVGWVCVVSGAPGEWRPFGGIGHQ
jgi:hypothetical protein